MTVIEQRTMEALLKAANKYTNPSIDWEQRRFQLARDIFIARERLSLTPSGDAEIAIDIADDFLETYKRKEQ